jgi:hypothetical protein
MKELDVTDSVIRALQVAQKSGGENTRYQETLVSVLGKTVTLSVESYQAVDEEKVWKPNSIRFMPTPDVCQQENAYHYRSRRLGKMASSFAFGRTDEILKAIDPKREEILISAGWDEADWDEKRPGIAKQYSFEAHLYYFTEEGRKQFTDALTRLTRH